MRVLFTTYSDRSLLLSAVPLAWALQTAGHDVRVASAPGLAEAITGAGLTAVPVGRDDGFSRVLGPATVTALTGLFPPYDVAVDPGRADWEHMLAGYDRIVGGWHKVANIPMIADLVTFARHWRPDLVLWEPSTFAGAIAARACGAAHGRLLWSVDFFARTREHYLRLMVGRPPEDRRDPLADWLAGYAERYDIEPGEELITGSFTVDQLPGSMRMEAAGVRYLPVQHIPHGGRAVVPDWLRRPARRPRVAITFGITAIARFGSYNVRVQDVLDSLGDLDVEVVAVVAETEQQKLAGVPGNVRLVDYVPLQALAPTCAAIIHHGGPGTLLTAARHAVPQLVVPWELDAPELARRFAATGAGLAVAAAAADGPAIRENVVRLLGEPAFRRGAERLRDEILALPEPAELVPRLVELAGARRAVG